MTIIIKVDSENPSIEKIRRAAEIIRKGGTVAFPTETVYGLGADALNPEAVRKIYEAKERPPTNPLIIHIAEKGEVYRLAEEIPDKAFELMDRFWPGPLTLILKASKIVPKITTAGLETTAIRMPSHRVALALIRESSRPIAAPSANLAGRPSPTTAEHVVEDLYGRIDAILDGGPTPVGVESTVLDMTTEPPKILRPGGVSREDLEEVLGRVEVRQTYRHYKLRIEVILVEGEPKSIVRKVRELAGLYLSMGKRVGILTVDEHKLMYETYRTMRGCEVKSLGSREDPAVIARNLFGLLREFEGMGVDLVLAEGFKAEGLGLTIMNRLRRASGFNIVKA